MNKYFVNQFLLLMAYSIMLSACMGSQTVAQKLTVEQKAGTTIGGGTVQGNQINVGGQGNTVNVNAENVKSENFQLNVGGNNNVVNITFAASSNSEEGINLIKSGKTEEAIQFFEGAQKAKPEDKYTLLNLANSYLINKQYEKAIADYDKTIRLDTNFAPAYNNRKVAYDILKQFNQALDDFNKALDDFNKS